MSVSEDVVQHKSFIGGERSAFTLVELLVGVSIFAVIATSLSLTFANGILLSRKARSRENLYQDAHWSVDALTRDLENLVPYSQGVVAEETLTTRVEEATAGNVDLELIDQQMQGTSQGVSFVGRADSLSFIISADEGLRQVRYYLAQPDQMTLHQVLVRHLRSTVSSQTEIVEDNRPRHVFLVREERPFPYQPDRTAQDKTQVEVLSFHAQPESLRFFYPLLSDGKEGGPVVWENFWDKNDLPAGVRIEIAFASQDDKGEPLKIRQDILVPLGMKGLLGGDN